MIEAAKRRAAASGVENISFIKSTLFDAGFSSTSFNAVLAFNVLHYMDDMPKVLQSIHELLVPGGLFISSTACPGGKMSFLRGLMFLLTKANIVPAMHFFKPAELAGMMEKEGFRILESQMLSSLPDYFVVAKKA